MSKKYFSKTTNEDGSKDKKLITVTSDEEVSMDELSESDKAFYEELAKNPPTTEGGNEFLVRGAKLRCDCGSHARMLNLPLCHGVYFEGHPLIRKDDCMVGDDQNITSFGVCSSPDNPQEKFGGKNIKLVQEGYEDEENKNQKKIKGAPCMPLIVDTEWKNTKFDFTFKDDRGEDEATTLDSYLICAYGGLIEPETSGQENVEKTQDSVSVTSMLKEKLNQ